MGHIRPMDLRSYREAMGWSLADVAGLIGVANAKVVHRHEEGSRVPRPVILEKYLKLTAGKVTADDFLASNRKWRKSQQRKAAQAETLACS